MSGAGNSGRRTDYICPKAKNWTVGSEGRDYGIGSDVLKRISLVQ